MLSDAIATHTATPYHRTGRDTPPSPRPDGKRNGGATTPRPGVPLTESRALPSRERLPPPPRPRPGPLARGRMFSGSCRRGPCEHATRRFRAKTRLHAACTTMDGCVALCPRQEHGTCRQKLPSALALALAPAFRCATCVRAPTRTRPRNKWHCCFQFHYVPRPRPRRVLCTVTVRCWLVRVRLR